MSKHLEDVKTKTFGFLKNEFFWRTKPFKLSTHPQSVLVTQGSRLPGSVTCRQELLLFHLSHSISTSALPDQPQPLVSSSAAKSFCHRQPDFSSAQMGPFTALVPLSRDQPSPPSSSARKGTATALPACSLLQHVGNLSDD